MKALVLASVSCPMFGIRLFRTTVLCMKACAQKAEKLARNKSTIEVTTGQVDAIELRRRFGQTQSATPAVVMPACVLHFAGSVPRGTVSA